MKDQGSGRMYLDWFGEWTVHNLELNLDSGENPSGLPLEPSRLESPVVRGLLGGRRRRMDELHSMG